jgi:gliding motility-associated-like protein
LQASGGAFYSWSPSASLNNSNIANPTASPVVNTMYRVSVRNSNNCVVIDSVQINVRPYPTFAATGDPSVCEGEMTTLTASGGDNYAWSPAALVSDPAAASVTVQPGSSTIYNVSISESTCGFDTLISMPVEWHPSPNVNASSSNNISCTTPTSQLTVQGADSYLWSPAHGVDDPAIANPIASVDSTTTFVVTGTSADGCSSSDTVVVTTEKGGIPAFLVPNAFTPNRDGRNDCFGLKRWGNVVVDAFLVYNRWGQIVFQTKNAAECWDGTFNGNNLDAGVYIYVIQAQTFCGVMKRTGTVTLIR